MLHLNGILDGRGEIEVGGMRLTRDNLPVIRAMVGLVFQNPDDQLFSPTVFEDVAFGPLHMGLPEAEVMSRVDSALEAVRMSTYRDRLSHHLSVGEKKRIAIATVLSMDPKILILDEPTAGLDPRARRTLINLLREPSDYDAGLHPRHGDGQATLPAHHRDGRWPHRRRWKDEDILEDEKLLMEHGLEKP